ncbi:MAG: D-cysteine desulfhydrase [Deltaproteobacteria bacterium]|jgi:D-cysteine desulfhydrase|nr:D-cysteine desulfhydrase [Deltaproteobacteria bacterium]
MNLHKFPRRGYVDRPTPIQYLPRLTEALGGRNDIFIKRDDLLPGCLGGNKTRKLDFVLGEAVRQKATSIVTCGAVQSNHCRLALAWANVEGLKCHLVLEERVEGSYHPGGSGNNLLFNLLGAASITVVPGGADVGGIMSELAARLKKNGERPYVVPGGAADPLGALGYAACAQEIAGQLLENDPGFNYIITATGSGGTHAGLLAGLEATGTPLEVMGINVRRPTAEAQKEIVAKLTVDTLKLLEHDRPFNPDKVSCFPDYLGPFYSKPDKSTLEAIELLAKTESIIVDPVYTGKALAGLVDFTRKERVFDAGEPVLFLHTGGSAAIFSYPELFKTAPPSLLPKGPAAAGPVGPGKTAVRKSK